MSRILGIALAAVSVTSALSAQAPDPAAAARRAAAIQRIAFIVGEWEGDASAQIGPGQRVDMRQHEVVQVKLQGQALLVEGTGRLKSSGEIAFNALAVITIAADGGYVMRSTTLDGRTGEFPLIVSDSGFVWGFDVPGGKVRYTTRVSAGEWHEVGEFTRDGGATWMKTVELRLKKK